MRPKASLALLCAVLVLGVLAALLASAYHLHAHRYLSLGMWRLAAIVTQSLLLRGLLASVCFFVLSVIGIELLAALARRTARKDAYRFVSRSYVALLCSGLVLVGGLAFHRFVTPFELRATSLAVGGAIVFAALALAWLLLRWDLRGLVENGGVRMLIGLAGVLVLLSGILSAGLLIDSLVLPDDRPNVIVIGIDTLRADRLGCLGHHKTTSPAIDRLAERGFLFSNALATTSWTLPSFHSILTGLYPSSHGVIVDGKRLPDSFVTFSEVMKNEGYATAAFVAAPYLRSWFGFNQGYDVYDESVSKDFGVAAQNSITSPKLTELALQWIEDHREEKFFLFLHNWDPHYDYIPPAPYDVMFDPDYQGSVDGTEIETSDKINSNMSRRDLEHILALYDGEIRWTDDHLGRFFATLEEWGLANNTIIAVVSDHGEEFLEHGGKGHGRTLYDESVGVPLILSGPGIEALGREEMQVSTIDLMPTILDLLSISEPPAMDGKSLVPLMSGEAGWARGDLFMELKHTKAALVDGPWKYILSLESGEGELYHLGDDPLELKDLTAIEEELANAMDGRLRAHVESKAAQGIVAPEAETDEQTLEQLRSLGYID